MKNNNRKNNKDISGEQKLRWAGSLSLTDEKYLDEADPDCDKINRGRKRSAKIKNENPKKKWFKAVIAAATLCTILIAFGIFLFLPYSIVKKILIILLGFIPKANKTGNS